MSERDPGASPQPPSRRAARRALSVIGVAAGLVLAVFAAQALVTPPVSLSEREPPGWPAGQTTKDLDGSLALLARALLDGGVTLPHAARIMYWSTRAYEQAAFSEAYDPEAGAVAFAVTAAGLLKAPMLAEGVLSGTDTVPGATATRARAVAEQVLAKSDQDGMAEAALFPGPAGPEAVPAPWQFNRVFDDTPALEPNWGSLRVEDPTACRVPPPVLGSGGLEADVTRAATLTREYVNQPAVQSMVRRWVSDSPEPRAEPLLSWVSVLQATLQDAGLTPEQRDRALVAFARDSHRALLQAWDAKWRYRVATPVSLLPADLPYMVRVWPMEPAYPDALAVLSGVGKSVLDLEAPGQRVRVEYPGHAAVGGRTRVLADSSALIQEITALPVLAAVSADRDVAAGLALGRCVAGERT